MKPLLSSVSDNSPAESQLESSSPAKAAGCPPVEELMVWFEQREQQTGHAFSKHLQKCPRCAHLVELAAAHKADTSLDEGIEDQDLLAIQPGLRTPVLPADNKPGVSSSTKSKSLSAKVPATTWELLTGRPVRPRKS